MLFRHTHIGEEGDFCFDFLGGGGFVGVVVGGEFLVGGEVEQFVNGFGGGFVHAVVGRDEGRGGGMVSGFGSEAVGVGPVAEWWGWGGAAW